MKKRSRLVRILFWISLVVLVFSLAHIVLFLVQAGKAKAALAQTVEIYVKTGAAEGFGAPAASTDSTQQTAPQASMPNVPQLRDRIDFAGLKAVNQDVAAWITIPALPASSFPVIWCGNDDDYLHRGWEGDYNWYGSIFMEGLNSADFSDLHTIVYGHNMLDGTMFGQLEEFQEEAFYQANSPYIIIYTPNHVMLYEIFSVEYADGADPVVYSVGYGQGEEYDAFVSELKNRSIYDTGVEVTGEDQVLTVSTCAYIFDGARFVLHAKQIWKS